VKMDGSVVDYSGTYEEYLRSQSLAGWCTLASLVGVTCISNPNSAISIELFAIDQLQSRK
jgi:hypothetical protein